MSHLKVVRHRVRHQVTHQVTHGNAIQVGNGVGLADREIVRIRTLLAATKKVPDFRDLSKFVKVSVRADGRGKWSEFGLRADGRGKS
jgi:hypothetical protein